MLRRALAWIAAIVAGLVLGVGSGWAALELGRASFGEQIGAWAYSRAAGSEAAGPYTRAIIAREALLALSAREARYFTLREDDRGDPLRESCIYDLAGGDVAARWWSVTLYSDDNFLAQNNDHAASVDASRIGAGQWHVRVAPVRGDAEYWLSSRNARHNFSITLRVYNPDRDFIASAEALPTLTRVSCAGGDS
jgi:hypothetical protein